MRPREHIGSGRYAQEDALRSRTITWEDPTIGAVAARTMSGLGFLRAIQEGAIPAPPMAQLMGMQLVSVEEGRAVFAGEPDEYHYNPIGSVHGERVGIDDEAEVPTERSRVGRWGDVV